VLATSPSLITPILGVAAATTINKVTITAPATSATLTLVQGSTLATAGAFSTTLTATAATNVTLPVSGTLATVLASGTIASAAVNSISLTSFFNYGVIVIKFFNIVTITNNVNILCRVSIDGTTYDSGANNYAWVAGYFNSANATGAVSSTGDTSIELVTGAGNTAGYQMCIELTIYNPSSTTFFPTLKTETVGTTSGPGYTRISGVGQRLTAQVTKGIQLLTSSGNISCSYRVIGYA
jgi:hypothetical protein